MLNFLEFFFYNGNFNKPQKYELFRANTLPLLHPANVGVCDVTSPFRYLRSSILIYFIHDYLVVFSFPNTRRIFFFLVILFSTSGLIFLSQNVFCMLPWEIWWSLKGQCLHIQHTGETGTPSYLYMSCCFCCLHLFFLV